MHKKSVKLDRFDSRDKKERNKFLREKLCEKEKLEELFEYKRTQHKNSELLKLQGLAADYAPINLHKIVR